MSHKKSLKRQKGARKVSILLFWLAIWYLLALLVDNSILLVTPWEMLVRLGELVTEADFWQTITISLLRIGGGFFLGFAAALLLAAVSLRYTLAEEALQPLMTLMKTVPMAVFVVLLLIWWGSSTLAVIIGFLVVLPNIYINTLEGLKAAEVQLLEMAKVFHISIGRRFFYIYRPGLKPFLMSGMKLSLGMCWKSGVAAEVIGTPEYSIGGALYMSKIHLDTAGVLAWTVVVVLLSLCFEKIMLGLAERFFVWNPALQMKRNHGRLKAGCDIGVSGGGANCENAAARLVVKHVEKSYGEQVVLSDMSAVYEAGNVYYLTSPSGSGKTTLFRLLCGLEKPDGGVIDSPGKFSMVFQEDRLCEAYTAVQNVALVTKEEHCAAEALQKLLPKEALSKPCSQLSGGMKRRVALVRAMEAESSVVLLDEPFTGMDAETKRVAETYIRERQRGRIVMIATHI